MNLLSPISTIMSRDLITVESRDSLKKVEEIFGEIKIHHLPVIKNKKLVGMISKSDYLFFKRGFNDNQAYDKLDSFRLRTFTVDQIMTTGIATMESNDKINIALEIFKENLFHGIPIVDDNKLVGIVTTLDIIQHLADDKGAINQYQNK